MPHISENEEKDCLSTLESDIGYYDMPECEDTLPVPGWAIVEAIDELKETRALFKKQWDRDQEAIKLAQEKGICDDMTWPDRGCLVMFLMDELDKAKAAQSAPVDLERVQRTLVLLFPFDRMEHSEAQKTIELMESMGLVFIRETDSDFEQEEYGDYVWLLTEKGSALLPTPSKE